ncbi:MAG: ABC transporter permease, partial [Anaerolineae bacterium]|nr:ABC transporter permease [Anaerolineae bacterium]
MPALARALRNEIHKEFLLQWSYRLNFLTLLALFVVMFLGASFIMGDGEVARYETRASSLAGFMVALFAWDAISMMYWTILDEAQAGTLEQMLMSPVSSAWLIVGRALARLLVIAALSVAMGLIVAALLDVDIPLRIEALPVVLLTLPGAYACGLAVAGLTLIFKQISTLTAMIAQLLIFVNGTFVGVDKFAGGVEAFAKLLPTTQGIIVLRRVLLDGESLADVWT